MGPKASKRNTVNAQPLSRETIEELCEDTGFTEDELLTWHTNFYKDCPDGKLTLKHFEQEYARIMGKPTQKTANYVRHMFNVYDQDKNQFIDFREFVMALSAASVVNRLRLVETLFHVFDLDNDGKITKDEIGKMLHTLVDVTNSNQKRRRHRHHGNHATNHPDQAKEIDVQKRVDDAFNELNANDDDHITKDEFIEWYMKSGLLAEVKADELNVPDTSRIQQLGKKSRKLRKQSSYARSNQDHEENAQRLPQLGRHMSRMTERRSPASYDDEDDDDDENIDINNVNKKTTTASPSNYHNNNGGRIMARPSIRITTSSDDSDSHYSKENERWQYLFNSVLGQIRSQRAANAEQSTIPPATTTTTNGFRSWKREGEEKMKTEYTRQKSNEKPSRVYFSTQNDAGRAEEPPPSPEVVTVRL